MSEIKLLPCPFCGGEAVIYHQSSKYTNRDGNFVHCMECGCRTKLFECYGNTTKTHEDTKQEAIEAWNTRKPMEQIVERLEEELKLSDIEKERCIRENPLQFDEAKGYSTGISNAIDFVKEEGGIE